MLPALLQPEVLLLLLLLTRVGTFLERAASPRCCWHILQVMAGIVEETDKMPQQLLDTMLSYLLPPACEEHPEACECVQLSAAPIRPLLLQPA